MRRTYGFLALTVIATAMALQSSQSLGQRSGGGVPATVVTAADASVRAVSILSTAPQHGEVIRSPGITEVQVEFSGPIDPSRLRPQSLLATGPNENLRSATAVALEGDGRVARFAFAPPLSERGQFTFTLSPLVLGPSGPRIGLVPFPNWRVTLIPAPTRIITSSPSPGEAGVSVNRETIVEFDHPLKAASVTEGTICATFGGSLLPTILYPSQSGLKLTLFYQPQGSGETPLPPSSRIRVTVDGNMLRDDLNEPVDADGDGVAGGILEFDFDTLTLTEFPGTAVVGRVFASRIRNDGEGSINEPLEGVTITVDGREDELFAFTDSMGNFRLEPAPAGEFFVHVDGRTATNTGVPEGVYYPFVGKAFKSMPGITTNPKGIPVVSGKPIGGEIYLPLVYPGTLQPVSVSQPTTHAFPEAAIQDFTGSPEFQELLRGASIDVPADALFADDGTRGGTVGIAPVPPDRIPAPLPPGLNLPLVITIQTGPSSPGMMTPTNFDRPVPVRLPNLPVEDLDGDGDLDPLPPGAKSALWSFDHDLGRWVINGPMTVTEDGLYVVSDPGFGVKAPGWHGSVTGAVLDFLFRDFETIICQGAETDKCTAPEIAKTVFGFALDRALAKSGSRMAEFASSARDNAIAVGADLTLFADDPSWVNGGSLAASTGTAIVGLVGNIFREVTLAGDARLVAVARTLATRPGGTIYFPFRDILRDTSIQARRLRLAAGTFKVAGAFFTGYDIGTVLRNCGCALTVGAQVDSSKPTLESRVLELTQQHALSVGVAAQPLVDAFEMMFGEALSVRFPPVQELSILVGDQVGTLEIRDGNSGELLIDPKSGEPAIYPMADLLNPRVITDRNLRSQIAASGAEGANALVEQLESQEAEQFRSTLEESYQALSGTMARAMLPPVAGERHALRLELIDNATSLYGLTSNGRGTAIVRGDSFIRATAVNARTGRASDILGVSPANGLVGVGLNGVNGAGSLGQVAFWLIEDLSADTDGDGLQDTAERAMGTDPTVADSDEDGILDGAEVSQGTDPLSGVPAATGVIASSDTPGQAQDICAINDVVFVADGSSGITVFNVFSGMNPTVVARFGTPSPATAIACATDLLAVATQQAFLIVDIADPPAARIVASIGASELGGTPRSVLTLGNLAFCGLSSGEIVTIDLVTGSVLKRTALGTEVHDLAVDGEYLFALTDARVYALALGGQTPVIIDSEPVQTGPNNAHGRKRLFAGGGFALCTHRRGFSVVNTSNPFDLRRVAFPGEVTAQFGWKQIVANGSGLGIATVSPNEAFDGPHNVSLYDLTNPGDTSRTIDSRFITTFQTPGVARAVSIYNALAYVADHDRGLQVINYRDFDRLGVPPQVSMRLVEVGRQKADANGDGIVNSTDASILGPIIAAGNPRGDLNGDGRTDMADLALLTSIIASGGVDPATDGRVEEGQLILVDAAVVDDVQVRSVEFLVDGMVASTDGNFPFQFFFNAPSDATGRGLEALVSVAARATDTGGNRTTAAAFELIVTPDITAPRIVEVTPPFGTVVYGLRPFGVLFSEPMDEASIGPSSVGLLWAGPDGMFDTPDDASLVPQLSVLSNGRNVIATAGASTPAGRLRLILNGSLLTDRAGNALGTGSIVAGELTVNDYPAGFVWKRSANYQAGIANGSTTGNPNVDPVGNPVWHLGWVNQNTATAMLPWYALTPTTMKWSTAWFGRPKLARWQRDSNVSPVIDRFSLVQGNVFDSQQQYVPMATWMNPTGRDVTVNISGPARVDWSCCPPTPGRIQVVVAKRVGGAVGVEVLFNQTFNKPSSNTTPEFVSFVIDLQDIVVGPGEGILFAMRKIDDLAFDENTGLSDNNIVITLQGAAAANSPE